MALVKCKECGNEISKKAKSCPQCGAPQKRQTSKLTTLILLIAVLGIMLAVFLPGAPTYDTSGSKSYKQTSRAISASNANVPWSGDKWPFTVASATLKCDKDAVILVADGRTYGVNGFAKTSGYADIEPIWSDNPDIPGTKISLSVIDAGLALCN